MEGKKAELPPTRFSPAARPSDWIKSRPGKKTAQPMRGTKRPWLGPTFSGPREFEGLKVLINYVKYNCILVFT